MVVNGIKEIGWFKNSGFRSLNSKQTFLSVIIGIITYFGIIISMDIVDVVLKEIEDPYGRPTDVIGFGSFGRNVANAFLPIVGQKEICFFDEGVKSDEVFHYLDFPDMLAKSEIMIFTIELPERYYKDLVRMNKKVKIFLPKKLSKTISVLQKEGYSNNITLL